MRFTALLLLISSLFPCFISARPWTPKDPCPTSIKTLVTEDPCSYTQCSRNPEFTTMDAVHAALTTCSNITTLDLRVSGTGCSQWPDRYSFPFDLSGKDQIPPLKSLALEGYLFEGEWKEPWHVPYCNSGFELWDLCLDGVLNWIYYGHWKTWLNWRLQPKEQRVKTNLELWLDAMDWHTIENFTLRDPHGKKPVPETLKTVFSQSRSLRSLEIHDNLDFIQALPPNTLTHLSWTGIPNHTHLPTILSHQGESLQSLEFTCPELWSRTLPPSFNISILPHATRNLTHLSINVPRNGTWPFETLDEIASIPTLRSADLWMHLQSDCRRMYPYDWTSRLDIERENGKEYCMGVDQFQTPLLDKESALQLFTHMREKSVGEELDEVTFWVGDWTRSYDGPLYEPAWVEGRRAKVACKAGLGSEVDMEDWCVVEEGEEYWKDDSNRGY